MQKTAAGIAYNPDLVLLEYFSLNILSIAVSPIETHIPFHVKNTQDPD